MSAARGVISEFRDFILRGNVIDLAVAFIAGAAFTGVVTGLVEFIISPLIAMVGGNPDFSSSLILELNGAKVQFGAFLTQVISFVITMGAVFFIVVKPAGVLQARLDAVAQLKAEKATAEEEAQPHELVAALSEIRIVRDGDGYTFTSEKPAVSS
jgi:large conductance mechanosensitive channel